MFAGFACYLSWNWQSKKTCSETKDGVGTYQQSTNSRNRPWQAKTSPVKPKHNELYFVPLALLFWPETLTLVIVDRGFIFIIMPCLWNLLRRAQICPLFSVF